MSKNLPATMTGLVASLESAATAVTATTGGDAAFMKFTKQGEWIFGADDQEVSEGSLWAVNPESFAMGFQAWDDDGELLGEEMALVTDTPIVKSQLPEVDGEWRQMLRCQMACIEGEEKGLNILYGTTSKGGVKAVNGLMQELVKRIKSPDADGKFVPVVELCEDSYKHKKYGKIYTPVLKVVEWMDVADALPEAPEEAEAGEVVELVEPEVVEVEEEHPAPRRRRRSRA